MLKPWHIKALWFKAALQDVLLEGQKSLTAVQWQQMCSMCDHPRSCARSPHAASRCKPVTTAAGTSAATTSSSNTATLRPGCGSMRSAGRWLTVRATALALALAQHHADVRSLHRTVPRGKEGLRAVLQMEGRRRRA